MKREEVQKAVKQALTRLKSLTGANGDILALKNRGVEVKCRNGKLENVEESISRSLTTRVFRNNKTGISATSDFSPAGIDACVNKAHEIAAYTQEDPAAGLADDPPQKIPPAKLELYHPQALEKISRAKKIALTKELEKIARDDKRISASNGATYFESAGVSALGDTRGFLQSEIGTNYGIVVEVVAEDKGGTKREGFDYDAGVAYDSLRSLEAVGKRARERAIAQLGAGPMPSGKMHILLRHDIAGRMIGSLVGSLTGTAFYKKTSIFIDQEGQTIAAKGLSLIDDPLLKRGPGSRLFDGEGYPSRRNILVDQGELKGILLDSYTARKLGRKTTASASRGRSSSCHPSSSNIIIPPGDESPEKMAARIKKLFWVHSLLGFQYNAVTGDFSTGASGFLYENGKRKRPLSEMTFSGNLATVLKNIVGIGNDPYRPGSIRSPSLLLGEITVAGK